MNTSEIKSISMPMLNYLFCRYIDQFNQAELAHVCDNLYYPSIEDRYLTDNPKVYSYIKWDNLDKMQAIRVVTRNSDLLKVVDLKKFKYKIREIFFFIQKDYKNLFKYFDFDFNNLSQDDTYFLLCLGQDDFLSMIDIKKYNFNFIESINIIRAFKYRRGVIECLRYEELKNYQITEILIMTGEEFLDLFSLDCLTTLNWLDLLMYRPKYINKCDFDKFISGDLFNLIQLIVLFQRPDLTYLLDRIDISKITPFGWEKLLISRPDKFASLCDFNKLNERSWNTILGEVPELIIYKNNHQKHM